jgi:FkbM family methyltransferase
MVCHMPWDASLGGPRVQIELAEELRRSGHHVEHYSFDLAYPRPARTKVGAALRPVTFAVHAVRHVRREGRRFDVVDAHHTDLPLPKRWLRFDGLVVARSAGLVGTLAQFERHARRTWPDAVAATGRGRAFGRVFEALRLLTGSLSLLFADVVNVPNASEREWLVGRGVPHRQVLVIPNGIGDDRLAALRRAAAREPEPVVAFIGQWGLRKGSADLPAIAGMLAERHPTVRFRLLGTGGDEASIRGAFAQPIRERVSVQTSFDTRDLPQLLHGVSVGLLPSYFEGFGIAILEFLAAGIPTVAYDVPGPHDILAPLGAGLLVPPGDVGATVAAVGELLSLPGPRIERVAHAARARAAEYSWSRLAARTVDAYERAHASVSGADLGASRVVRDLVFDVGFHRGEDAAFYLAKGYRVVAFEAHPEHVREGRKRFAKEIAGGRLSIVEGAITDLDADATTFYLHSRASEWGTVDPTWAARNDRVFGESVAIEVPTVDFAATLATYGTPYYLKVDIEGADHVCFEALRSTGCRPAYVSWEATKTGFAALRAEFDLLESLGYCRFTVRQQATIAGRRVVTTTADGRRIPYICEPAASGDFGPDLRGWTTRSRAEARFRRIYVGYRLFGDDGLLRRTSTGNRVIAKASGYVPFAVPGWHDVHARHRGAPGTPG